MKKYISSVVFGTIGVGAGFALCFVYLVIPQREAAEKGQEAQQAMSVFSKLTFHHDERGQYITLPGMVRHE
jgi:hypothetical protein